MFKFVKNDRTNFLRCSLNISKDLQGSVDYKANIILAFKTCVLLEKTKKTEFLLLIFSFFPTYF